MKLSKWIYAAAIAALVITIQGYGQANPPHYVYKLTQIGTFGGPYNGDGTGPANFNLNYSNSLEGLSARPQRARLIPSPRLLDRLQRRYAFVFQNGKLTNLGASIRDGQQLGLRAE